MPRPKRYSLEFSRQMIFKRTAEIAAQQRDRSRILSVGAYLAGGPKYQRLTKVRNKKVYPTGTRGIMKHELDAVDETPIVDVPRLKLTKHGKNKKRRRQCPSP